MSRPVQLSPIPVSQLFSRGSHYITVVPGPFQFLHFFRFLSIYVSVSVFPNVHDNSTYSSSFATIGSLGYFSALCGAVAFQVGIVEHMLLTNGISALLSCLPESVSPCEADSQMWSVWGV